MQTSVSSLIRPFFLLLLRVKGNEMLNQKIIAAKDCQILCIKSNAFGDQYFAAKPEKTDAYEELTEMVQVFNHDGAENLITMRQYAEAHGFVYVNDKPHFLKLPSRTLQVTL